MIFEPITDVDIVEINRNKKTKEAAFLRCLGRVCCEGGDMRANEPNAFWKSKGAIHVHSSDIQEMVSTNGIVIPRLHPKFVGKNRGWFLPDFYMKFNVGGSCFYIVVECDER